MNTFTWDYKILEKYNKDDNSNFQLDWNQTLTTTLNIIARSENILDCNNFCLTPIKYQTLIESLSSYNKETKLYKNFKFEFIQSDNDVIKINNNIELKILNYNG